MDTFSFLLRRGVWITAFILLGSTFFSDNGVLMFAYFLLVAFCAVGYSWLDNATFGELLSNFAFLTPATEPQVYEADREHQAYRKTYYHRDTPQDLVQVLEGLREKKMKAQVHFGDPVTGLEKRVMQGYINCSTGAVQIPLFSPQHRQGGAPLIDHSIVRIMDPERGYVLYQHPTYHHLEAPTVSSMSTMTLGLGT